MPRVYLSLPTVARSLSAAAGTSIVIRISSSGTGRRAYARCLVASFELRNSSFSRRGPLLPLTRNVKSCTLYDYKAQWACLPVPALPALSLVEGPPSSWPAPSFVDAVTASDMLRRRVAAQQQRRRRSQRFSEPLTTGEQLDL
jgi:hypothetical protein